MRTFVDPREQGGKLNSVTTEDLVELLEIDGEEWLRYKSFPINVAFIRGTTCDPNGNITMEREALTLDNLAAAMAAKNSRGFVIAQVERIAAAELAQSARGAGPRRSSSTASCWRRRRTTSRPTARRTTTPSPAGSACRSTASTPMALDERKIIARRCAFELPLGGVVNLGIGMPEGVAAVAAEERILKYVTLTAEPGIIGGIPQGGLDFGAALNPEAVHPAEPAVRLLRRRRARSRLSRHGADRRGRKRERQPLRTPSRGRRRLHQHLAERQEAAASPALSRPAASRSRSRTASSASRSEGRSQKFIEKVEQITFSGRYAAETGQPVYYVTERCVFQRTAEGVELVEIAPGIDPEKDILPHMGFRPIVRDPRL